MTRESNTSGVRFEWRSARAEARVEVSARCSECGRLVERSAHDAQIVGFVASDDPSRDAQARAVLTRSALGALRAAGCTHAMHDRAALADCILRPDRAQLARVLAALFETSEEAISGALAASGFAAAWTDDGLTLSWAFGAAPRLESEARVTRRGPTASASVTMSAAEAWELIASRGFVPVEWLGSEARGFRGHIAQSIQRAELPEYGARGRRRSTGAAPSRSKVSDPVSASPRTLRACVSIAADCEGAIAAEALVREVIERLEPWGVERVRRLSWRTVDASRWRTERQSYWSESLRATIASVLAELPYQLPVGYGPTDPAPRPSWWSLAAAESSLARLWQELAAAGVARADGITAARLRDFRALANPFEPLLAIWSTGFVFDALGDGEAVLVASEW
ncbi:MAG: hypothetical protein JNK05_35150 [Myxococcales bacterium]|nr:hypothetical protein [Myxococcales bacterium]